MFLKMSDKGRQLVLIMFLNVWHRVSVQKPIVSQTNEEDEDEPFFVKDLDTPQKHTDTKKKVQPKPFVNTGDHCLSMV